ncbi:MAG TPA: Hsp20/alpha crystallin family protein [Planctomycetota bacterium]|nr:Hsp20/alpha crystallin family protein [Planctomycetota bacterium]
MSEPFFDFVFDLLEEGEYLLLEVALPGVLESEIDLTLEGSRIIIRAERPAPRGSSILREIKRGILTRDLTLPCAVELLKSRYEDGVLWLQFKRLEPR